MPIVEIRVQGSTARAIYDDALNWQSLGFQPPARASHVEPIPEGVRAGQWYVDMSPLGPDHHYWLWPLHRTRADALRHEHEHLSTYYIRSSRAIDQVEPAAVIDSGRGAL